MGRNLRQKPSRRPEVLEKVRHGVLVGGDEDILSCLVRRPDDDDEDDDDVCGKSRAARFRAQFGRVVV